MIWFYIWSVRPPKYLVVFLKRNHIACRSRYLQGTKHTTLWKNKLQFIPNFLNFIEHYRVWIGYIPCHRICLNVTTKPCVILVISPLLLWGRMREYMLAQSVVLWNNYKIYFNIGNHGHIKAIRIHTRLIAQWLSLIWGLCCKNNGTAIIKLYHNIRYELLPLQILETSQISVIDTMTTAKKSNLVLQCDIK